MTTVDTPRPAPPTTPVPMSRLVHVELRKLTDTRSGRWLLITMAGITALIIGVALFVAPPDDLTFETFLDASWAVQALLLPVLGILAVTSEWGQRTGLVTFTLEPRRARVVGAKLIAVLLLGLAGLAVTVGLATVATVLGRLLRQGSGSWALSAGHALELVSTHAVGLVLGMAFGMLFLHAAGAIVAYYVLPIVVTVLVAAVDQLASIQPWVIVDLEPLGMGGMDGRAWAQLGVSLLVSVLLPWTLGCLRLLRSEIKSA